MVCLGKHVNRVGKHPGKQLGKPRAVVSSGSLMGGEHLRVHSGAIQCNRR